jgi:hypothetical protein
MPRAKTQHSKYFLDYERGFPKKAEINTRELFSDNAENAKLRAREQEDDYGKESETRYLASVQEVRHHDKDKEANTETCYQKAQPNSQLQRNNRKSRNQVQPRESRVSTTNTSIFPLKDFRNGPCQRLKSSRVAIGRHNNGDAAPRSICHSRVAHSAYCAPRGIFRNIAASQRRMMPLLNGRNKR